MKKNKNKNIDISFDPEHYLYQLKEGNDGRIHFTITPCEEGVAPFNEVVSIRETLNA